MPALWSLIVLLMFNPIVGATQQQFFEEFHEVSLNNSEINSEEEIELEECFDKIESQQHATMNWSSSFAVKQKQVRPNPDFPTQFIEYYQEWSRLINKEDCSASMMKTEIKRTFEGYLAIKDLRDAFHAYNIEQLLDIMILNDPRIYRSAFNNILNVFYHFSPELEILLKVAPPFVNRFLLNELMMNLDLWKFFSFQQMKLVVEKVDFTLSTLDVVSWIQTGTNDGFVELILDKIPICDQLTLRKVILRNKPDFIISKVLDRVQSAGNWEICAAMERGYPNYLILKMIEKMEKINGPIVLGTASRLGYDSAVVMEIENRICAITK